jgi:hypothetical protein
VEVMVDMVVQAEMVVQVVVVDKALQVLAV